MARQPTKQAGRRIGRVVLGASVSRDKADLIERAADLLGETVSGFVGDAATKRAERELAKAEKAAA